jgi:hypothetical protein
MAEIAKTGAMLTPILEIDGVVRSAGKVLKAKEIALSIQAVG